MNSISENGDESKNDADVRGNDGKSNVVAATHHAIGTSTPLPSSTSLPAAATPSSSQSSSTSSTTSSLSSASSSHTNVPTSHPAASTGTGTGTVGAVDMNRMVVFCADKAGMSTSSSRVSKEQINQVIYEMSVGSKHYQNQEARNAKVGERIKKMKRMEQEMKARWNMNPALRAAAQHRLMKWKGEMEAQRNIKRYWIHVDMDSFYASCEIRDRPELADKPVAVGGMSMISTSNYVARQYGVRSAMPGFIAVKLCPDLIFLPHNWPKYQEAARLSREIFADYDPDFEAGSLDEAYLDVTNYVRKEARRMMRKKAREERVAMGDAKAETAAIAAASTPVNPASHPNEDDAKINGENEVEADDADDAPISDSSVSLSDLAFHSQIAGEVASEIRSRIYAATKLTASAGIACNRLLAKISTDMNKPNGQYQLASDPQAILAFMAPLSVRKVPGIGKVTERILNEFGIETCAAIHSTPETFTLLHELFSQETAHWLLSMSMGFGSIQHESDEDARRKSISTERTFRPTDRWMDLRNKLEEISTSLAEDVRKHKDLIGGKNVTLKLKTSAFDLMTRSVTLDRCVHSKEDLYKYGLQLLKEECNRLAALKHGKHTKHRAVTNVSNNNHSHSNGSGSTTAAASSASVSFASPTKPGPAQPSTTAKSPHTHSNPTTLSPTATSSLASTSPVTTSVSHPRDGLLHLRLMGLRLSALKEESSADYAPAGNSSILKFVKQGQTKAAAQHSSHDHTDPIIISSSSSTTPASVTSSSSSPDPIAVHKNGHDTDADITSFFGTSSDPDAAFSSISPSPAAHLSSSSPSPLTSSSISISTSTWSRPTLDRFLRPAHAHVHGPCKGLEPSFTSTTQRKLQHRTQPYEHVHDHTQTQHTIHPRDDDSDEAMLDSSITVQPSTFAHDNEAPIPPGSIRATSPDAAKPSLSAPSPSTSATASSSSPTSTLTCPICNRDLGRGVGLVELNLHIDTCLARSEKRQQQGANGSGSGSGNGSGGWSIQSMMQNHHGRKRKGSDATPLNSNKGMRTLDSVLFKRHPSHRSATSRPASAASSSHSNSSTPTDNVHVNVPPLTPSHGESPIQLE